MTQLTVHNVATRIVRALNRRAAAYGRSSRAEHREILGEALLKTEPDFAVRAKALRDRLHSSVDSSALSRADRDRDTVA
jgi:plasmid stability protein